MMPWMWCFLTFTIGIITVFITLGKTHNCRNHVLRAMFRVFMVCCVTITSKFQFENLEKKKSIFDYIFFANTIIFDGQILESSGKYLELKTNIVPIKYRFDQLQTIFPQLHSNIQCHLFLDMTCLTTFYIAVMANHRQFHDSFSLSFTVIVLFCMNMGSSVLNMIEYHRNIKYVSLKCEYNFTEYEISIMWWKPEGDVLVGYLFGLIYFGADILLTEKMKVE
jgi:hypothetical protein